MMSSSTADEAYRQAGVDLDRAGEVVTIAKQLANSTATESVTPSLGGFSGAFELPADIAQPVLLTACDGVGTKLKIAFDTGIHTTIGIDLVAMCVNDILVNGGRPLAFLDYLATAKISPEVFQDIVQGIAEGCKQAGCALVGGETAEMPGFYQPKEYDVAGFCVGAVSKPKMLPKLDAIKPGDKLIGLASSGLHSNGYSLVRKLVFQDHTLSVDQHIEELNDTLGNALLTPTRIYVKPVLALLDKLPNSIKAMAHITGGGFYENIPRVLPPTLSAHIHKDSWTIPPVFRYLQNLGQLSDETLYQTFNCGIGFVLVVNPDSQQKIQDYFAQHAPDIETMVLGEIIAATAGAGERSSKVIIS
ncbi:MAG: phosphoribosylformylglycinamidine cyclo-ligase [Vampirovibrio sp.]|nr:phosphoribosylformylglycinamidine cyclo-ligase [Vampirovibrio sp.]